MAITDAAAWIDQFDGLAHLPPALRDRLTTGSAVVTVPAGTQVFAPGQSADNLLLLLAGTVRVSQQSENGREVFLYRVHAGESCVLTTACMLSHDDYAAYGLAETQVRAVAIPRATFDHTVDHVLTKPGLKTVRARVTGNDAGERTASGLWPSDHGGVISRLLLRG